MSEATIVIESAEKGGSLITANLANDYNRDVFAVPGRTTDKYSQGCNELIKTQRAQLITSAADLIYNLNWQLEDEKPKTIQKQLFVSLDADEQKSMITYCKTENNSWIVLHSNAIVRFLKYRQR